MVLCLKKGKREKRQGGGCKRERERKNGLGVGVEYRVFDGVKGLGLNFEVDCLRLKA